MWEKAKWHTSNIFEPFLQNDILKNQSNSISVITAHMWAYNNINTLHSTRKFKIVAKGCSLSLSQKTITHNKTKRKYKSCSAVCMSLCCLFLQRWQFQVTAKVIHIKRYKQDIQLRMKKKMKEVEILKNGSLWVWNTHITNMNGYFCMYEWIYAWHWQNVQHATTSRAAGKHNSQWKQLYIMILIRLHIACCFESVVLVRWKIIRKIRRTTEK